MAPESDSNMQAEDVKRAIHEALNERERIDHDLHKADHDFVREMRLRYQARKDFWDRLRKTAIGTVVTMTVGKLFFLLYLIGDAFLRWWHTQGGN